MIFTSNNSTGDLGEHWKHRPDSGPRHRPASGQGDNVRGDDQEEEGEGGSSKSSGRGKYLNVEVYKFIFTNSKKLNLF